MKVKFLVKKKVDEIVLPDVKNAEKALNTKVAAQLNKINTPPEVLGMLKWLIEKLPVTDNLVPKIVKMVKDTVSNKFGDSNNQNDVKSDTPIKESIKRKTIKVIKKKDL